MEIMKLIPTGKDYLWGGTRLREEYGKQIDLTPLAETWECSVHPDGPSYVANGIYKGQTLAEVLSAHPEYLGTKVENGELPVLVKFIDAKKDLSVQVHPDDAYAREHEGDNGKTEMWYVVDTAEGAHLRSGFSKQVTPEEYAASVEDNTITDILADYAIRPGDVFFLPAGRVHSIGAGAFIAEIQQTSDITYRIYDYGRLGADGKPRQLHIPQALDVTLREPPKAQYFHGHLAQCDYFTVDAVEGGFEDVCDETSFTSLLVLEGKGTLTETATGESLPIRKGQSLFLPAGTGAYAVTGTDLKCLRTRV